jgi:hypothetical protein
MTGGQGPRDWDKELAQIDKLIAAGRAEPPAAPAPAASAPAAARGRAEPEVRPGSRPRAILFTWLRLLLGLLLGVAITQWPYAHGCGVALFGYLVAVAGVIVAGVWSAISSWRTRSALAHALSLALFCWGGVLAAREVLPRVGYARASATWLCHTGTGPAPAPPPPGTSTPPQGAR